MTIRSKADVPEALKQVAAFCKSHEADARTSALIPLCVEEMVNNILEHGFKPGREHQSVDVRILFKGDSRIIRIRDNCVNFDPLEYLKLHGSDDPVAHIGIRMVMRMVKSANYVNSPDFVLLSEAVPDAILEIRYYSTYNFIGNRIDGYEEPLAILTKEAAAALKEVSDELVGMGYRLKIFDAYRPQMAVTNFMNWALDPDDARMKDYFYPELEKSELFPQGYIAEHSGHSRGSTVDLTLFDMTTEREVDMGGTFDHFGQLSHPDYMDITEEQYAMRMLLREVMLKHGFKPLEEEWWHFTLENEPFPETYFTFPINSDSVAPAA